MASSEQPAVEAEVLIYAEAVPVAASGVFEKSGTLGAGAVAEYDPAADRDPAAIHRALANFGLTPGLAAAVAKSGSVCATRYWIVDNSGSMQIQDGCIFLIRPNGAFVKVPCSRWDELASSLRWHSTVAHELCARTEFRLLNQPPGLPKMVVFDGGPGDAQATRHLDEIIRSGPQGLTPLCAALKSIVAAITRDAPELRASQRTAGVMVASDGEVLPCLSFSSFASRNPIDNPNLNLHLPFL